MEAASLVMYIISVQRCTALKVADKNGLIALVSDVTKNDSTCQVDTKNTAHLMLTL
jgi:hypothetical protein